MELHEHEEKSQHRYEKMMHAIHETKKEAHMSNAPMIFEGGGTGGMGAAMGGGLGAGLLGGLLGGVLFGGGLGVFNRNGNWNGEPPVTSSQLTAALAGHSVRSCQRSAPVSYTRASGNRPVPRSWSQ